MKYYTTEKDTYLNKIKQTTSAGSHEEKLILSFCIPILVTAIGQKRSKTKQYR